MRKLYIVKRKEEFDNIINTCPSKKNSSFVIYYKENTYKYDRFGISVGKKIGNAVTRNLYKRKIRSLIDNYKKSYVNQRDYIKLIIAAKKILESNRLIIMPYIISSKINRLITRKNVNKKELTKIQSSQFYQLVIDKYKNPKIEDQILSMIAGILSSEFEIIDFYDDELDGRKVDTNIDLLLEEVLMYVLLI